MQLTTSTHLSTEMCSPLLAKGQVTRESVLLFKVGVNKFQVATVTH